MQRPLVSPVLVRSAAALLITASVQAQQLAVPHRPEAGPPLPAPQNLQVLPRNMAAPQVIQLMQNISGALGVQCGYCHVANPAAPAPRGPAPAGRSAPPFDFASDENPRKKVAREMLLLVRDLNPKVASAVGKSADATTRVGCITCHRGVALPKQIADILDDTTRDRGTPAAVAQFRDLREHYFGSQAYDFSEGSLVTYAQRLTQASKADDAVIWLQLNLEYFPMSARTYGGLAQAQQATDPANAVKSIERAVELDPQNAALKKQLDQLKGQ